MMTADLVILNSKIITMDPRHPLAEAVAVKGENIIAVGRNEEIRDLIGSKTDVIDAKKKTVLPGFIDAHCHMSEAGRLFLQVDCHPKKTKSIEDMLVALREKAHQTPAGKWVLGERYDDTKLLERRHPTRWDLDRASKDHPIHLGHISGHVGVINSKAMEMTKLTQETEPPQGGVYDRDEKGELTGVCREEAEYLFHPNCGGGKSFVPYFTRKELKESIQLACQEYNRYGITSVGDAIIIPEDMEAYQDVHGEGRLTVRVYLMILDAYLPLVRQLRVRTGFGDHFLRLGSVKSFVDGAISARTAWLSRPYEGRPEDFGIPTKTPEQLEAFVFDAHQAGFQISIHANGDRAIEMVLDAYENVMKQHPRNDARHRIEHCTVVHPEILRRIKQLGVVVAPFATYIYEHGEKMGEYGERISMMFAYRSFLDYGIHAGVGSDHPAATQNPLIAIQSMVTRMSEKGIELGACQKISLEEALRICTMEGAYASFEEKIKGSLEIGKLADFVVLSEDPFSVSSEALKDIRVEKTFVGGKGVYSG